VPFLNLLRKNYEIEYKNKYSKWGFDGMARSDWIISNFCQVLDNFYACGAGAT